MLFISFYGAEFPFKISKLRAEMTQIVRQITQIVRGLTHLKINVALRNPF